MENSLTDEIIETDIAIIGGGSAGITLASKLSQHSAVVIDLRPLPSATLAGHYGRPLISKLNLSQPLRVVGVSGDWWITSKRLFITVMNMIILV